MFCFPVGYMPKSERSKREHGCGHCPAGWFSFCFHHLYSLSFFLLLSYEPYSLQSHVLSLHRTLDCTRYHHLSNHNDGANSPRTYQFLQAASPKLFHNISRLEVTMWKSILMFICILPLLSLYFSTLAPCKVPSSLLSTELTLCQVLRNLLHKLQVKLVIYHNIIQLHMSETTLRVGRSSWSLD